MSAGWRDGTSWCVMGDGECCELLSRGTALCQSLPTVFLSVLRLGSCSVVVVLLRGSGCFVGGETLLADSRCFELR